MPKRKEKGILLPTFLLSSLFFSLIGSFYNGMQHLNIMGAASDRFSYNFGKTYSWNKGYNELKTGFEGYFPETKCGALSLAIPENDPRENRRETYYVFSEKCGELMGLTQFASSYYSEATFGELMVKGKEQDVLELVKIFNELKARGVLEDIRFKNVTIYDWDNIKGTAIWTYIFPAIAAGVFTYIVHLRTKKIAVRNFRKK